MLYGVGKNLIPNFNDPGWFMDYSATGGTMVVDPTDPNKMSLTITASAQGRLIWIPVEKGKSYTFSFKNCTGLYRLYKRKVGNHDAAMVLANHSVPGMPLTYTFTPDDTYQGFITLRLTHSVIGTYNFENLQLEEGSVKTVFEPYKLGNLKAEKPKDIVASNMTGSTHKPTNGNVFTILKDVKVKTSQINVMETGDFNIAIYEWVEGAGITGSPLVKIDKTYNTTGVYTIDFGGVLLKAGKKYWIGRYIISGQAGVMRALGYDAGKLEFVTWNGGADYTGKTVVYPTTYYYFFSLIMELPTNKTPSLTAQKNLLKDVEKLDTSEMWIKENGVKSCVKTGEKFQGADVYRITFQPDNNGRVFQYFDTKGKVSASVWVRYIQYDTTLVLTLREQNFGVSAGLVSINTDIPEWQYIRLENANVATDKPYMFALYKSGKSQTKDVIVDVAMPQLEKGLKATEFGLYKSSNPLPVFQPKKNLLKTDVSAWVIGSLNATDGSDYTVSNAFRYDAGDGYIPVKPNTTYTVSHSSKYKHYLHQYTIGKTHAVASFWQTASRSYTTGANTYFVRVIFRPIDDSLVTMNNFKDVLPQLEEGSLTPYEPYRGVSKPAVKFPNKNLIDFEKFDTMGAGTVKLEQTKDYFKVATSINAAGLINQIGNLKPSTTYAIYAPVELLKTVDDVVQIRIYNRTKGAYISTGLSTVARNVGEKVMIGGTFSTGAISPDDKIEVWIAQTWFNGVADQIEFKVYKEGLQLEEGTIATSYVPYKLINKPL